MSPEEKAFLDAREVADRLAEEARAAGRAVPEASPDQKKFWARCFARIVKGMESPRDREGIRQRNKYEWLKSGGPAADEALKANSEANRLYDVWQASLGANRFEACPNCSNSLNYYASPIPGEAYCRSCHTYS